LTLVEETSLKNSSLMVSTQLCTGGVRELDDGRADRALVLAAREHVHARHVAEARAELLELVGLSKARVFRILAEFARNCTIRKLKAAPRRASRRRRLHSTPLLTVVS
jgi:hypothetical protein